jgi:hypothetical protein
MAVGRKVVKYEEELVELNIEPTYSVQQ